MNYYNEQNMRKSQHSEYDWSKKVAFSLKNAFKNHLCVPNSEFWFEDIFQKYELIVINV